jgi:hypothetical protein
LASPT